MSAGCLSSKNSHRANETILDATTLCRTELSQLGTGATQVGKIRATEEERLPLLDRSARELFVRESHEGLFRWFYRLMGSPEEAADLTQDTFLAFWDSL